jgi:hypothetical protein
LNFEPLFRFQHAPKQRFFCHPATRTKAGGYFFQSPIPLSCKRFLKQEADDFIEEEAKSLPFKKSMVLSITATERPTLNEYEISTIIHKHFAHCKQKAEKQLGTVLKLGERRLLIGFVFLVDMFLLSKILAALLDQGPAAFHPPVYCRVTAGPSLRNIASGTSHHC